MKKYLRKILIFSMVLAFTIGFGNSTFSKAASIHENGEYSVPFSILKGDSDESSMTNDYVSSPANVIVQDGTYTVQFTINNASWWQSFQLDGQNGNVVSEDKSNDTEVVQFTLNNIENLISGNIHVIVPDIDYDNKYDIRFNFDTSGMALADGDVVKSEDNKGENETSKTNGEVSKEENPPTSDNSPIVLFAALLLISGYFLVRKFNTQK